MVTYRARRTGRAFTLLEIMIVILIISILLAIAVPSFVRSRAGAQARSCQHNLVQIIGAKERWAMDNNRSPSDTPTQSMLTPYYTKNTPICPASGTYVVGRLDTTPTCTVGGTVGAYDAHLLP